MSVPLDTGVLGRKTFLDGQLERSELGALELLSLRRRANRPELLELLHRHRPSLGAQVRNELHELVIRHDSSSQKRKKREYASPI